MKKGLILSLKIIVLVIFVAWVFIVFIEQKTNGDTPLN